MAKINAVVNKMPTLTWNFLRINDINLDLDSEINNKLEVDVRAADDRVKCTEESALDDIKCGMGDEAGDIFKQYGANVKSIKIPPNIEVTEPVRIDFKLGSDSSALVRDEIIVGEGSKATIIMNYFTGAVHIGKDGLDFVTQCTSAGIFGIETKIKVCEGAHLTLVKTNLLCNRFTRLENIGCEVDDRGSFEIIELELGGYKDYVGTRVDLKGYKSDFKGNFGYFVNASNLLDINYEINHIGRKSTSDLQVKGALRDKAVKNFRGTIDLRKGAKGAVGNEQEETLLINPGVHNKTLPIILCDEEDVEGTHGASIGRLSEDVLFYLTSRGISEKEAELMMTKAKLDSVRRLITDEESQGRIQQYLERQF